MLLSDQSDGSRPFRVIVEGHNANKGGEASEKLGNMDTSWKNTTFMHK